MIVSKAIPALLFSSIENHFECYLYKQVLGHLYKQVKKHLSLSTVISATIHSWRSDKSVLLITGK